MIHEDGTPERRLRGHECAFMPPIRLWELHSRGGKKSSFSVVPKIFRNWINDANKLKKKCDNFCLICACDVY